MSTKDIQPITQEPLPDNEVMPSTNEATAVVETAPAPKTKKHKKTKREKLREKAQKKRAKQEKKRAKKQAKKEKKEKGNGKFYMLTRAVLGAIMRTLYPTRVIGAENIPKEGGAIICSNHIGYPDALLLGTVMPRQVHFLAKDELFHIPVLATLMRGLSAVPVKRNSADVGAIKEIIRLSTSGRLVAVFPQGHRRYGQNPADTEIKHGIGIMAYRSKMPVLPICIKMKKERYCIFRRVNIIIGTPVMYTDFCEGHSIEDYAAATRAFFDRTCELGGYLPKPQTIAASDSVSEAREETT